MGETLVARLTKAHKARWLAGLALLVGGAFVKRGWLPTVPLSSVQLVGLFVLAYNWGLQVWLRRLRGKLQEPQGHLLAAVANTQVAVDIVAFVVLAQLTGGTRSPLVPFLVLYMAAAGLLLSRPAARLQSLFAIGLCSVAEVYAVPLRSSGFAQGGLSRGPVGAPEVDLLGLLWLDIALFVAANLTASLTEKEAYQDGQIQALEQQLAEEIRERSSAESELRAGQRKQLGYIRRVSHELKSPLASIATMLQVVLESLTGEVPEKQRDLIQRAERRATAALSLVEDLLTLSRVRELAVAEEVTEVDLEDLIADTIAEEELAAQRHGVVFVREVDGRLPLIRGHAEGLQAMLRNLVSNAVKYSPQGGQVRVAARAEQGRVVIEVEDHGIGIPEEDLGRIFDDFYRTPLSRQLGIMGTGLGLPIVKSVVEHHGGEITVESKPGTGTLFRVTLPITGASETTGAVQPSGNTSA